MSSSDFKKHSVIDSRLDVKSDIDFSVFKGGANVTAQTYNAISKSTSNIVFNVQMPSIDTVFNKEVLIKTTMIFKIEGTGVANPDNGAAPALLNGVGTPFFRYGACDSLSAFPFHQLILNANLTLNNTSVNTNMRDVLPVILKSMDVATLQRWNSLTPCMQDTYFNYLDSIRYANTNDVVAGYNGGSNDSRINPRGAWVLDSIGYVPNATGALPAPGLAALAPNAQSGYTTPIYVKVTVTEPLLISPLSWSSEVAGGLSGVQTFGLNLGLSTDAKSAWSSAYAKGANHNATLESIESSQLLFTFLTPSATMIIPKRCVSSYLDLPRYITPMANPIAANADISIDTTTISLNVIPDALILYVRIPTANQTMTSSQSNLCIKSVTISFNNQAGICANMSSEQLWKASTENGANQSWNCWNGSYHLNPSVVFDEEGAIVPRVRNIAGINVASSGSILILKFGKDINLNESYLAPSSLGQYQFQARVTVHNQSANPITPEVVCVFPTSGLFVNEGGQSNVYTGLLSKADVVDTGSEDAYTSGDINRMMGSGWKDTLKSLGQTILKHAPTVLKFGRENYLDKLADDHKHKGTAEKASKVLKALGMGKGLQNRIK